MMKPPPKGQPEDLEAISSMMAEDMDMPEEEAGEDPAARLDSIEARLAKVEELLG